MINIRVLKRVMKRVVVVEEMSGATRGGISVTLGGKDSQ